VAKRRREYFPPEACLKISGVHETELKEVIKELEGIGAKNITVHDDESDYSGYTPDSGYHILEYTR
jgi:hypothetical protein